MLVVIMSQPGGRHTEEGINDWDEGEAPACVWERRRAGETASPEEALAAFARQGIEVVTLRQISTHAAGSGLLVFCHLSFLVVVLLSLPRERFSGGLHSSGLLTHSHLRDDEMILASLTSYP